MRPTTWSISRFRSARTEIAGTAICIRVAGDPRVAQPSIIRQCIKWLREMPEGPVRVGRQESHAALAQRHEDVDGSADPSLQALYRGRARARGRGLCRRRAAARANSASIWSPTAPTSPIAARSARRASSHLAGPGRDEQRAISWPTWCRSSAPWTCRVRRDRPLTMSETLLRTRHRELRKFTAENEAKAQEILKKYPPSDASRVASCPAPLAQAQHGGWLPRRCLDYVAGYLGMPKIRVYEVASLLLTCTIPNPPAANTGAGLHDNTPAWLRGSDDIVQGLQGRARHECRREHRRTGASSCASSSVSAACCNAPMMWIDDHYYEDLTTPEAQSRSSSILKGRDAQARPVNPIAAARSLSFGRRAHTPCCLRDEGIADAERQGPHLHQSLWRPALVTWMRPESAATGIGDQGA